MRRVVVCCVVLGAFYFATPYDLLYTVRDPHSIDTIKELIQRGDVGRRLALPALGALGAYLCLLKRERVHWEVSGLSVALGCYLLWAVASVTWSDDMGLTLRKLIAILLLWFGAWGIAVCFPARDLALFACVSGLFTMVLGIGAEAFLGVFHPLDSTYRFAGTFHPNTQGLTCSVFLVAAYALYRIEGRRIYLALTMCAGIGLMLTKSRNSIIAAAVALGVEWLFISGKKRLVAVGAASLILIVAGALLDSERILEYLNRITYFGREESDLDTLSLRLPLWKECARLLWERPIVGFGYDSFWTPRRVVAVSTSQGWSVPHSHSGYLEVTLGTGMVGLAAFAGVLVGAVSRATRAYAQTKNEWYVYCLAMIVWLVMIMAAEIVNMHPFIANFVCMVVIAKLCGQAERRLP